MTSPIESLIEAGSKIWIDGVDPDAILRFRRLGATGATSNPSIISKLVASGRFDDKIKDFESSNKSDEDIAWQLNDYLVSMAQSVFMEQWRDTNGNDGYVSFELDPLLEDEDKNLAHKKRVEQYIELGKKWSAGHDNRMIKVPATKAGIEALEPLAAAGVTLNVTLIFTGRQYEAARDAIWRGARQLSSLDTFKSVYSIFISRIDVYTQKHISDLDKNVQGQVGLINAKQVWQQNQKFWSEKSLRLDQEIVFASTGAKLEGDAPDKYVQALVGSDIQTNPPQTLAAIETSGKDYTRTIDSEIPQSALDEISKKIDVQAMEDQLMKEGNKKFCDPQKEFIERVKQQRAALAK